MYVIQAKASKSKRGRDGGKKREKSLESLVLTNKVSLCDTHSPTHTIEREGEKETP